MATKNIITGASSPRSTGLKGWSFWEWFKGNYKSVKEIIKVGTPLVLSWLATADPVWTIVVTALGKLALDIIDYYFPQI